MSRTLPFFGLADGGEGGPRLAELARHAVVCQAEELIPLALRVIVTLDAFEELVSLI